jgi:hypothetical protein
MNQVLDVTQTDQGGSVAGGWAYPFKLPQDTDNVLVKFTPSVTAGGASVTFQTSDDGGTTYYDVARTSIASNNNGGPFWMTIPTIQGPTIRSSLVAVGSVITVNNGGQAGASTLAANFGPTYSGLPIMGLQNRVFVITAGNATAVSARVQVMVNQQSATA